MEPDALTFRCSGRIDWLNRAAWPFFYLTITRDGVEIKISVFGPHSRFAHVWNFSREQIKEVGVFKTFTGAKRLGILVDNKPYISIYHFKLNEIENAFTYFGYNVKHAA